MKVPARHDPESSVAPSRQSKLPSRHPVVRPLEGAVIALTGTLALGWFHLVDGFGQFVRFVVSYEAIELDEILFVFLLGGLAALFLAIRRTADLRRQIAMRIDAERRVDQLALDPLSGLPSRHLLMERLSALIARDRPFCVLLIDLDKFKPVNDVHGHEVGDLLLVAVASRLRQLGEDLFVSRLGGDEFVILTQLRNQPDDVALLAEEALAALHRPFLVAGRTISIGATIGISQYPDYFRDPQNLLRGADLAMYCAKRSGRGSFAFFDRELNQVTQERAELELQVRSALAEGQIKPYFQPIVDLGTQEISGLEALARWEHPGRGLVGPSVFLPIVDDLGLQDALLETILRQSTAVMAFSCSGTSLAVNISASQLRDPLFAARLLALLRDVEIEPSCLIIEVTEGSLKDEDQIVSTFAQLRACGVRLALDDFGKSYSNLRSLRKLKFDHLKVHGSFLPTTDDENSNALSAVISLAKELGVPSRAQGVETPELAALLGELGCAHAQGYYFGHAVPAAQLELALRTAA